MFQTRQPLNNIAPFYIGNRAFVVDLDGNVFVNTVVFPDGSSIETAGSIGLPSDIDAGTF